MLEPTADAVSQRDLEKLFYESVEHCQYSEVQTEIKLYKELPESQQTQSELRRRIDKVLRKKEANDSRKAHEKYLNDLLSLGGPPQKQPRGQAGKEQKDGTKTDGKKSATKNAKDASGGGNGGKVDDKVKEQLSHKDRQLSGLAAQLRSLGASPNFLKKSEKGKDSRSSSSDSSKKSS